MLKGDLVMENNIDTIIANALIVNKDILAKNIEVIIQQLKVAFDKNKEVIVQTNEIDKKKDNGFIMDFGIIDNLFQSIRGEALRYGQVTLSQKDDEKKIIYGKQIMDKGNVIVVTDGNPYVLIEMILKNILVGNTVIFVDQGYMYGTNRLIIEITQSVLERLGAPRYLIQIYNSENFDEVFANYANIDLVVCVGSRSLQNLVLTKSKNETIVSGYENFDLYIEDTTHIEFLKKIMETGLPVQVYIQEDQEVDFDEAIRVADIEEAIAQINYNGNKYSTAIFTQSADHASQFIREVKSAIVTVNTSPTIERIIDIKQTDLMNEKTVIYPMSFKFEDHLEIPS